MSQDKKIKRARKINATNIKMLHVFVPLIQALCIQPISKICFRDGDIKNRILFFTLK